MLNPELYGNNVAFFRLRTMVIVYWNHRGISDVYVTAKTLFFFTIFLTNPVRYCEYEYPNAQTTSQITPNFNVFFFLKF